MKLRNEDLFECICRMYGREMYIHPGKMAHRESGYSYVAYREIVLPERAFQNPSGWDVLTLLHEIGHIKTNTERMKLYEKEYLATQWSADEAKKWDFTIIDLWRKTYQDYIFSKRDICIREGGKNVPPESKLMIRW